jgi:predicted nuclease of predicted toxin-antitoxin system
VKILIDMNLSPIWAEFLASNGFEAVHSSAIGHAKTSDDRLMEFARESGYLVFTHDLDFGDILAATNARGPSVIQVRTESTSRSDRRNCADGSANAI